MSLAYNHEPPLDTTLLLTSYRYLPGGTSAPHRKPAYVRKCLCEKCKEERFLQLDRSRQPLRGGRNEARRHKHVYVDGLEAEELVREGKALPGDYAHAIGGCPSRQDGGRVLLKKRPSLSREEAFQDPSTCKTSRQTSWSDGDGINTGGGLTDLEVAELYHLGILYDDEHVRGSGFDFSAIVHEEPVFSFRPAKRQRKTSRPAVPEKAESVFEEIVSSALLPLNLSFADLGSDEAIAHYLTSNPDFEFSGWEEQTESEFGFGGRHSRNVSTASNATAPSVTVIYEVDEEEVPEVEDVPGLTRDHEDELTQESESDVLLTGPHLYDTDTDEEDGDAEGEDGWDILPESVLSRPAQSPNLLSPSTTTNTHPTSRDGNSNSDVTGTKAETDNDDDGDDDDDNVAQDTWIVLSGVVGGGDDSKQVRQ